MEADDLDAGTLSFYCTSGLLGLIFNSVMLWVVHHQTELQDYMRVLYQCLGAFDLILGINWSLWSIFWFSTSKKEVCTVITLVFPLVHHISLCSVMACLCGISFNLYLLVTKPLRYHAIVTGKRFYMTIASTLTVITLTGGIFLPIKNSPIIELKIGQCLRNAVLTTPNWASLVNTLYALFPICATMTFTTSIYIRLLLIARKKLKETNPSVQENHGDTETIKDPSDVAHNLNVLNDRRRKKMFPKGILTIIILTGSFYLFWTPRLISYIIPIDMSVLDRMSSSNTWIQPLLYLVTNAEVRRMCFKCFRRNQVGVFLVRRM